VAVLAHPRVAHSRAYQLRKLRGSILFWAALALFIIFASFPVYWMFVTTFKEVNDLYNLQNNPLLFHLPPTLDQVQYLFERTNFATWVENTGEVGLAVVLITVVVCVPAAYVLARSSFPGSSTLGIGIFLTYLVPPTLLFLPLSRIVTKLHLKDSLWSLILVYPSFTIPFATWLLMGFFKTIPQELEDAALVDGCSRLKSIYRIVLPVSLPGILTVVIFAFSLCVNEFIYAFTFISSSEHRTVSAGIPNDLIRGDVFFWQSLMAATLIPSILLALLYNCFLDRFIAGFTGGAFR